MIHVRSDYYTPIIRHKNTWIILHAIFIYMDIHDIANIVTDLDTAV